MHVREAGSEWERRHLLFRDHLRGHPDAAGQYGKLKMMLATCFATDRAGYVAAKAPFIEQMLADAERLER